MMQVLLVSLLKREENHLLVAALWRWSSRVRIWSCLFLFLSTLTNGTHSRYYISQSTKFNHNWSQWIWQTSHDCVKILLGWKHGFQWEQYNDKHRCRMSHGRQKTRFFRSQCHRLQRFWANTDWEKHV
jgi:hypothetical protein